MFFIYPWHVIFWMYHSRHQELGVVTSFFMFCAVELCVFAGRYSAIPSVVLLVNVRLQFVTAALSEAWFCLSLLVQFFNSGVSTLFTQT